jgi:predicted phosphoribosyltransferase
MFENRYQAAQALAEALSAYTDTNALVLGIPRGGVEIGYYIARHLNADFSLVITRKLGYPENPEAAFGAIAEDGSTFISASAGNFISNDEIAEVKRKETMEIQRRIDVLRKGKPLPSIDGRIVILADDGIATGATLFATIMLCRKRNPARLIAAAPIASQEMASELHKLVDEVIILETPPYFYAVSQGYRYFKNLNDEQTIAFMDAWDDHMNTTRDHTPKG